MWPLGTDFARLLVMSYLTRGLGLLALLTMAGGLAILVSRIARRGLRGQIVRYRRKIPLRGTSLRRRIFWLWAVMVVASVVGPCLGAVVFGRPVFGLLVPVSVPLVFPLAWRYGAGRLERRLEESALIFFQGLDGLTRAGMALPSALFRLTATHPSEFAALLGQNLAQFESGVRLSLCLARFRRQTVLRRAGMTLLLMETAYRRGLAISPLLARALPALDADLSAKRQVLSLRRSALLPVAIAMALPWFLGGVMLGLQPELMMSVWQRSADSLIAAAAGALVWECLGGGVIWVSCRYY
jgi:Flp pilus assembly protein TadB